LKAQSKASAPAKVILFGEHFAVYDKMAVVMAINKRAYVTVEPRADDKVIIRSRAMGASGAFTLNGRYQPIEGEWEGEVKFKPLYALAKNIMNLFGEIVGLEIKIDSSIPISAGLGSSAAVSVASAAAILDLLEIDFNRDMIFKLALESEKIVHKNPSGVDPAISTYGGIIVYRRSEGIKQVDVDVDLPLIIGDTRVERSTGEMVSRVGEVRKRYQAVVDRIMDAGDSLAALGVEALKRGDLKILGDLMNINHALLCALGVSSEAIEKLINAARRAGALGAKLTGAGGGGCIIALSLPEDVHRVAEAIRHAGGESFITNKALEGVKIEG